MKDIVNSFSSKLYSRELHGTSSRSKSYRELYGDRRMIDQLDIVNELDGHSGCVNALSWSRSGSLLASGSDDQHLNVHTYQPENSLDQFQLSTTVATGHTQNIFSVKFMPHHNDRKVITAAGDGEVRVFDLEYAGQTRTASTASSMAGDARRGRRNNYYNGVRYLSDGDTDCRVYRSHGDRVKRIVTESSPFLFLTCSEDGEVRQWDMRQPSSSYPAPRGGRFGASEDSTLPPPLISYKRYHLDLNSISCSPSQPHYIALGGAHLHAFLHDRRMAGRDLLNESGKPLSPASSMSSDEEQMMSQATQCVRKFAPDGRSRMKRGEGGHITALKISDGRPNEMIVSWSGDHIYNFDLVRGGTVGEAEETIGELRSSPGRKAKESRDRKRKRRAHGSESSVNSQGAAVRASSRPRTGESGEDGQDTALRVRYQNGQSEDIPISSHNEGRSEDSLSRKEKEAQRLAKATAKTRSALFGASDEGRDPTARFTSALSYAAGVLEDMDDTMRDWRYPIDPAPEMVALQRTYRQNRESARRFVQAAGTIARVLGGKIQTSFGTSPLMNHFASVEPKATEASPSRPEQFGYDFLKAILLWLESGIGRLIEGFTRPAEMNPTVKAAQRLPIPEDDASTEAIDEFLIPYLLGLASETPVINVETNRFEVDANRQLFASEKSAVLAFAAATKIPFEDLSSAVMLAEGGSFQAQDRQTTMRHWGLKVARGVLLNAAEGVDFAFVSRAFGGPGRIARDIAAEEARLEPVSEVEDEAVEAVEIVDGQGAEVDGATADDVAPALRVFGRVETNGNATRDEDEEMEDGAGSSAGLLGAAEEPGHRSSTAEFDEDESEDQDDEDDDDMDEEDDSDDEEEEEDPSSDASEEDGVPNLGLPRFILSSAASRRNLRSAVQPNVPSHAATRSYRGHCNVKTVKDVNYLGLNDEYVVSGSDDGNFFIWAADTGELINVLEGDGEVVNVVTGHPYEPVVAVSGIDHTIKIFSPDARARERARRGDGVASHDANDFSSIAWPSRMRRGQRRRVMADEGGGDVRGGSASSGPPVPAGGADVVDQSEDEDAVAPTGLTSRRRMHDSYRITSNNDRERQGGAQDGFLTRSMLGQLARHIQQQRAAGGEEGEEGAEGEGPHRIVLGDDCVVQ